MTARDYSSGIAGETLKRSAALVETIKPLLAGQGPDVQGAALVDLVSTWLAGHPPQLRALVWQHWTKSALDLVPLQEAQMFKTRERPEGWQ